MLGVRLAEFSLAWWCEVINIWKGARCDSEIFMIDIDWNQMMIRLELLLGRKQQRKGGRCPRFDVLISKLLCSSVLRQRGFASAHAHYGGHDPNLTQQKENVLFVTEYPR